MEQVLLRIRHFSLTVSFQQRSKLAFPITLLLPEIPAKCDNLQGKQRYYGLPGWGMLHKGASFLTATRDMKDEHDKCFVFILEL
jgi:hypothetical protein